MNVIKRLVILVTIVWSTPWCHGEDTGFARHLLPLLENHCFECHGDDQQKGDLALHNLNRDVVNGGDEVVWAEVLDQLNSAEMPPKKKKRPPAGRLLAAINWLSGELDKAETAARTKGPRIVLRRLNRLEYRNTMRDLVGHPFDPTELFSPDTVSNGFDHVGEALVVSPLHVESFVAATGRVLDKIIDIPEQAPRRQHWRIINSAEGGKPMLKDDGRWHDGHVGKNKARIKGGFFKGKVLPNIEIPSGFAPYSMVDLTQDPPKTYEGSHDIRAFGGSQIDEGVLIKNGDNAFGFKWFAYEEGLYRVRLHVSAFGPEDWKGPSPKLGLALYPEGTMWREQLLAVNRSQVIEFELYRDNIPWHLKTTGNRNWGVKCYYQVSDAAGSDGKKVPFGIHVAEIEVEGPLNPVWPPEWHRRIFPQRLRKESDEAYAERVLRAFMKKAYRRDVSDEEVAGMVAIYRREKAAGLPVKKSLRMPLATILTSPSFLFIANRHDPASEPGVQKQVSPFELASRLSYFLWRSMPDEELFTRARSGDLLQPDVLASEIRRMLEDPRSEALVTHFTRQWLGLDKLERLKVDPTLHPDYDLALYQSMVGEATAFFREILHEDLSLYTFIDSDFLMLDERLARHYRIPGVRGNAFRRVRHSPDSRRGGVLTQAAVLTATSNGIRTQPIRRGAFILEEILADPPKPPPADVPPIEDLVPVDPATGLRKRLEQHRSNAACLNCHRKIDPLGFALENYDAIGMWREHELVASDAAAGETLPYRAGKTITIRFANGTGASNDFIAILPAGARNDESYRKPGLYEGSPIWKHTTDTQAHAPNGVFSGTITLTAPVEPGDYEARLYFAGDYNARARSSFTVVKAVPGEDDGATRPPLLLDPASGETHLLPVAVDPAGKLPDGRAFRTIGDFKRLLLEDKEAFLQCMTKKMLVYALGRPVGFADRTLVRDIVGDLQEQPTLGNLINRIVMSEAFQDKGHGR